MESLSTLLSPIQVHLDDLLLDANNPRFSELGDELNTIPESRFADAKVQANAYDKMRNPIFDVAELRDTIRAIGFLPMDRIVVRRWKIDSDPPKFIVIEGNRRVTALKWLRDLHDVGKETFDEERLNNITSLEALLLNDDLAPDAATLILPGLRHVSGIKEWGPYQKAKAVHALRETGMSAQESAQSLGLSTRAANSAYRCFMALENMKSDEEFGEFSDPRMYSYFEEVFKRPAVKNWLKWSDDGNKFEDKDRLSEFYGWMVPPRDEDEGVHKLPEAKSVRVLADIIEDDSALNVLRSPDGSLTRALARYEVDHPEDWYPKITAATGALQSLTPKILREMDKETIKSLSELKEQIEQALRDRESLLA
jgi:DNA-directed RNA polymerase subunit L